MAPLRVAGKTPPLAESMTWPPAPRGDIRAKLSPFPPDSPEEMRVIKDGSQVKLHYTLTVDQMVIDSSKGGEPLSYTHGQGQIVPGLEEQLEGLAAGQSKEAVVTPDKGYGAKNPDAVQAVPRTAFQDAGGLKVGDMVTGEAQGRSFQARVTAMDTDSITLDLNHPLAGKTLHFAVEIVEVN